MPLNPPFVETNKLSILINPRSLEKINELKKKWDNLVVWPHEKSVKCLYLHIRFQPDEVRLGGLSFNTIDQVDAHLDRSSFCTSTIALLGSDV